MHPFHLNSKLKGLPKQLSLASFKSLLRKCEDYYDIEINTL